MSRTRTPLLELIFKLKCNYCYELGNLYKTNSKEVYEKHITEKHPTKPMYPNLATIKENGLRHQGEGIVKNEYDTAEGNIKTKRRTKRSD
jgi:hypothetical protein